MQYQLAPSAAEEEDVSVLDAKMHPMLLVFKDEDVEARYSHFVYVKSGFYGGKLWLAALLAVNVFIWIFYHGLKQGWEPNSMFFSVGWVLVTMNTIVAIFTLIGLFVERLFAYREALIVVGLIAHWPAICLFSFFGHKDPWPFRWMIVIDCVFFCAFHTQSRFSRIVWVIGLVPIITITIAMIVAKDEYWDGLSYLEFWFWLLLLIPAFALRILERETRRAFLRMEACDNDIAAIERSIAQTQTLVVNFFARTPTRDFLSEGKEVSRSRRYNEVMLVVTDLAGFTAWASRTETTVVVDHIAMMFARLDEFAVESGVEKVSSVGDSYQGIIFPHEDTTVAARARAMLHFALRALQSSTALQLRVGVHYGNVTAAFIGSAPPKFDLFGEDFEIAKQLESEGIPGKVHASPQLLTAAAPLVEPSNAEQTSLGVAFTGLRRMSEVEIPGPLVKSTPDGNDDAQNGRLLDEGSSSEPSSEASDVFSPFEIQQICRALAVLANGRKAKKQRFRPNTSVSRDYTPQGTPAMIVVDPPEGDEMTTVLPGDDSTSHHSYGGSHLGSHVVVDTSYSQQGTHQGTGSMFTSDSDMDLSSIEDSVKMKWYLKFADPTNELMFMEFIQRSGIQRRMNNFLIGMIAAFLLAFHFLGCTDGMRNRLLVGAAVLIYAGAALSAIRVERPNLLYSILASGAIAILIGMTDTGCSESARHYLGSIFSLIICNGLIVCNFWLAVPIYVRLTAIFFLALVVGNAILLVRIYALGADESYDPVFTVQVLAFSMVGITIDFTLRTSFAADRRLRLLERKTRSRFYQNTTVAMDVMLPQFVSHGLLQDNAKELSSDLMHEADGVSESATSRRRSLLLSRSDTGLQRKRLWEFKNVCVMFATVDLSSEASSHADELPKLNGLFLEAEEILRTTNVQKIKTIGSTLMCVCGIPDGDADPAFMALQAAVPLVRRVLITSNRTYRIGLHVGPCFGAVLGTSSLLFDVYGDTVNMASRMTSTAAPNTIQVSEAVQLACKKIGLFEFEAMGPVDIKGKGSVSTYRVVI